MTKPVLIAAVAATALLAPAGAAHAATTSSTCANAAKAKGVTRIAKSSRAVVFARANGDLLGCAYGGKVSKLTAICCEGQRVKVAGTFAFYAYQGSAVGDETDKLGLYDLRTGKRLGFKKLEPNAEGPDPEIETYSSVSSLTVTAKGSVAWIVPILDADGEPAGGYELRIADGPKRAERIADSGRIARNSAKLSADEKTLTYTKDGKTKSAAIAAP